MEETNLKEYQNYYIVKMMHSTQIDADGDIIDLCFSLLFLSFTECSQVKLHLILMLLMKRYR